MADQWSRSRLINSTGAAASTLTSSTFICPLRAQVLTLVVSSDRACTMTVRVLRDKAAVGDADAWLTVQSETVAADTPDVFVYNGNYGAVSVVLTAVGSSAWNAEVYGQAS